MVVATHENYNINQELEMSTVKMDEHDNHKCDKCSLHISFSVLHYNFATEINSVRQE